MMSYKIYATSSTLKRCMADRWLFLLNRYQIGIRYTGGARMLLMLSLKFSIIPIVVPVNVRNFDIDGELWVKLRLIPTEPWVGAVSWAFVSLPKIKFDLSPFRLFNLMGMLVFRMICAVLHYSVFLS